MAKIKPFSPSKDSVFSTLHREFVKGVDCSRKITLTRYCQLRFVSKRQARRFIRKGWLTVTRQGRNLWVQEVCTEEIDDYLGLL